MNLARTLAQYTELQKLTPGIPTPEGRCSALQIAELVFKQAEDKNSPFLYMDAEDWAAKWLASKRFTLQRIPIAAAALPCQPKDANWVLTTFHARREPGTERPIVVDFNKRQVGAAPSGFTPAVIVIDGKHRFKAASLRGDTHILAWVGELAAEEFASPYAPNRSIHKHKPPHIRKAKGAKTPNMHIRPPYGKIRSDADPSSDDDGGGVVGLLSTAMKLDSMDVKKMLGEYGQERVNSSVNAKAPPGWTGTTEALKKHVGEKNAFALSWWMYNKGRNSHIKPLTKKQDKRDL